MEQTARLVLGCGIALALLTGFIGCAGHQTGTAVGHDTQQPPAKEIALPDLVVEEHVKEEPVVPSAVPPGSVQPQQEAAAVVEPPPKPAVVPMPEPAPVPPPPAVTETDLLPFPVEPEAAGVFLLDIPFNFDQYSLRDDALAFVEVNATRVREEGVGKVLLEGRGDEVGTADYNLVLGERRAREVKRYLQNLGLKASTMRVVSYGKERPLCFEHTTECWQLNRSVRMVAE